jgi:hypothetical protein
VQKNRKTSYFSARKKQFLIRHPEQPQWNFVAEAYFDFVCRDETIGNVLDLCEFFALAADFKKVFVIDEKVATFGELY